MVCINKKNTNDIKGLSRFIEYLRLIATIRTVQYRTEKGGEETEVACKLRVSNQLTFNPFVDWQQSSVSVPGTLRASCKGVLPSTLALLTSTSSASKNSKNRSATLYIYIYINPASSSGNGLGLVSPNKSSRILWAYLGPHAVLCHCHKSKN